MNNPFADLFPPIPQKFVEMIVDYCGKDFDVNTIHSGVYLKRLAELDLLDLNGFCGRLNYNFFAGHTVLNPDYFGIYNINEIVSIIKEKSALGSVLED